MAVMLVATGGAAGAHPVSRERSAIHKVSPQLMRDFAVLRIHGPDAHVTNASSAPAVLQNALAHLTLPVFSRYGLDTAQLEEVSVGASGSIWTVPGSGGLCVFYAVPANPTADLPASFFGGCSLTSWVVKDGEIARGTEPDGTHILFGLVPNGNARITATMPSGAPVSIPVTDNAVLQTLPAKPTGIDLNDASGAPVTLP